MCIIHKKPCHPQITVYKFSPLPRKRTFTNIPYLSMLCLLYHRIIRRNLANYINLILSCVRELNQFPPLRLYPIFSVLWNHRLLGDYHDHIWHISLKLRWRITCQLKVDWKNWTFTNRWINTRSFSDPHSFTSDYITTQIDISIHCLPADQWRRAGQYSSRYRPQEFI